jgi:hypothetical protein
MVMIVPGSLKTREQISLSVRMGFLSNTRTRIEADSIGRFKE